MSNFFELLNQTPAFELNLEALECEFIQAQKQAHPDNFMHIDGADLNNQHDLSALINQAYMTLRDPLKRAIYYLSLHNVLIDDSPMPLEFLMEQMDFRDTLEAANTPALKESLQAIMRAKIEEQYDILKNLFLDNTCENLKLTVIVVKKLRFWTNIELHEK